MTTETHNNRLIDRFGRHITYVRLSITDRCDLRCVYCMSEDMQFLPRDKLLSLEETARLGRIFVALGVRKIRITGGEPLVRRNALRLFQQLGKLPQLEELTLTTNGSLLPRYAQALADAGVSRINISLDSLRPERYAKITRVGKLEQTLQGIEAARRAGFQGLKLNCVMLRGYNHDESSDLLAFALEKELDISFIEEMPLGEISDRDRQGAYYSSDSILADLRSRYELVPSTWKTGGPSRYYLVRGAKSKVGFISPHSHNFCASCNRVRVTAEGRLLLCLGQEHSVDLRPLLRRQPQQDAAIRQALITAMEIKPEGHDFDNSLKVPFIRRYMNMTGG